VIASIEEQRSSIGYSDIWGARPSHSTWRILAEVRHRVSCRSERSPEPAGRTGGLARESLSATEHDAFLSGPGRFSGGGKG
jgi:hypothetical protein